MKRTTLDQTGFIPLLITILLIVIGFIYFVYMRLRQASQ